MFLLNGVDGTTMSQIADEENISGISLQYYFRNKEGLLYKVLETIKTKITPTLSEIVLEEVPVMSKIEKFINIYFELK